MTDSIKPEQTNKPEDLTGRDKIVKNVLTGWVTYLVFLVSGFIMPRLIDNYAGQFALGIWDFCWTFINYIGISGLGLSGALNRFVPGYRTTGELHKLNQAVSTVVVMQAVLALFVITASVIVFFLIPVYFSDRLGDQVGVASWVVLLLGASMSVEMLFDASKGVLTGYHRWDVVNAIFSLSRIASTTGMIIALLVGGGLVSLGAVYFIVTSVFMLVRYFVTRKLCPDITVKLSLTKMAIAKEMFLFGIKTHVITLPRIFLLQTINIIVAASMGPAALAIFTRPVALVKYIDSFISRFSFVLTPIAGAIQASGDDQELRDFVLETTRTSVAITLPLLMLLAVFGDVVIGVWMGSNYVNHPLIILLAMGAFLPASQQAIIRILMGMNMHGRVGFISFIVSLLVFLPGYYYINGTEWTLMNAASLIVLPEVIGTGLVLPIYACRIIGIPFYQYLSRAFFTPVLTCSVFLGIILLNRALLYDQLFLALTGALLSGGVVLIFLYWKFLLTPGQRIKVSGYMKKFSFAR
ncbi:MAG TPA: transporter [Gammaproteobacteria bacterium]|nr:transporter [Gammaproteobacteria bacterium]